MLLLCGGCGTANTTPEVANPRFIRTYHGDWISTVVDTETNTEYILFSASSSVLDKRKLTSEK